MRQGEFILAVARELDGGRFTARQIATNLRRPESSVWRAAKALGRDGEIVRVYRNRNKSIRHVVYLPAEIDGWLRAETPPGASVTDLIAAVITDGYLDAKEQARV